MQDIAGMGDQARCTMPGFWKIEGTANFHIPEQRFPHVYIPPYGIYIWCVVGGTIGEEED